MQVDIEDAKAEKYYRVSKAENEPRIYDNGHAISNLIYLVHRVHNSPFSSRYVYD